MTAKVLYEGGLRCKAIHKKSGSLISTDAPIDDDGKGETFSPTDLIATALGTSMLTTMGMMAEQSGINMKGATADINKVMVDDRSRIIKLEVVIHMPDTYPNEEREILEKAAHGCPVMQSLHPDIEENVIFDYPE